ncbi:cytochrome c family protein [Shinella sp. CPCC 101442]|uniref:c-type cytochrome n=1 Tax=Shinella sp. CPCC 101442 TaxID=2932265 RepID=UPI0021525D43|nr:cytochrome c family protein [Shinella sp. CPCC 101442]MCR6502942.1 cytochrome c family protein [Shinella sp. CPCC 101442]
MNTENQTTIPRTCRWNVTSRAKRPLALMALLLAATPSLAEGDPVRGKTVFARCGACHSTTGQNRMGPPLDGIVGRPAGTSPGARYSNALKGSGLVWNDDTLNRFLEAPRTAVPGTTMMIGLALAKDRMDIIAYLKTLTR